MGKNQKKQKALVHQNKIAQRKLLQLKKRLKWQKSRTHQKNLKAQHLIRMEFEKQPQLPASDELRNWISNSHKSISELEEKLKTLDIQAATKKDGVILNKLFDLQLMLQDKLHIEQACTRKKTLPRKLGSTSNTATKLSTQP